MRSALRPVQLAITGQLRGHAPFIARVTGVLDHVPEAQAFPYVVVGEFTEAPFHTFGRDGSEITATLHIWSQYRGWKECTEILALMNGVLDNTELEVEGYQVVSVRAEESQTIRDSDGKTRHLVARYRFILQEA